MVISVQCLRFHFIDFQIITVDLLEDYQVPQPSWNHMELVWAKQTGKYVNSKILHILNQFWLIFLTFFCFYMNLNEERLSLVYRTELLHYIWSSFV